MQTYEKWRQKGASSGPPGQFPPKRAPFGQQFRSFPPERLNLDSAPHLRLSSRGADVADECFSSVVPRSLGTLLKGQSRHAAPQRRRMDAAEIPRLRLRPSSPGRMNPHHTPTRFASRAFRTPVSQAAPGRRFHGSMASSPGARPLRKDRNCCQMARVWAEN